MVTCLTPDQGAAGSSFTRGTALHVSMSKTLCPLLSAISTQEDMTGKSLTGM